MLLKTKIFYTLLLFSSFTFAQLDPGFGDGGGGDPAQEPAAPIDNIVLPLLLTGVACAIYYSKKNKIILK